MNRERCAVVDNRQVAPGHHVLRIRSKRISGCAKPGQFVMISFPGDLHGILLPRPFSFLEADGEPFSILSQVVGKGTDLLRQTVPGQDLWVLGPLGSGFSHPSAEGRVVLVGGGVGIPPLHHLARSLRDNKIYAFLGARTASVVLCRAELEALGASVRIATDDGSAGFHGVVTELVEEFLPAAAVDAVRIYGCGPRPMLKRLGEIAHVNGCFCEIALEESMACGFGVCLGCAVTVRRRGGSGEHDVLHALVCSDGPVFEAQEIVWQP